MLASLTSGVQTCLPAASKHPLRGMHACNTLAAMPAVAKRQPTISQIQSKPAISWAVLTQVPIKACTCPGKIDAAAGDEDVAGSDFGRKICTAVHCCSWYAAYLIPMVQKSAQQPSTGIKDAGCRLSLADGLWGCQKAHLLLELVQLSSTRQAEQLIDTGIGVLPSISPALEFRPPVTHPLCTSRIKIIEQALQAAAAACTWLQPSPHPMQG